MKKIGTSSPAAKRAATIARRESDRARWQEAERLKGEEIFNDYVKRVGPLRERLIESIKRLGDESERTRYQWLERRTGISARAWKNMMNEQSEPTLDMVCRWCSLLAPEDASWIILGRR